MKPEPILAKSIREILAEVAALKKAGIESLTDSPPPWLASQYFIAAREAARQSPGAPIPLDTLRSLTAQIVSLRRGDHYARQPRPIRLFSYDPQPPQFRSSPVKRGQAFEHKTHSLPGSLAFASFAPFCSSPLPPPPLRLAGCSGGERMLARRGGA